MPIHAAFAVPGSLTTQTGGYFYDRRLLDGLRALGHDVAVVTLPDGFPDPGATAMRQAVASLASLPPNRPVIVDGLAFGALPTEMVARFSAPLISLVHHPLALEPGLDPATAQSLHQREAANLRHARHILVPSPHTKATLVAQYAVAPDRITVLLPGIDRPATSPMPKSDPPLILSVGILHPRKGHDVLIAALGHLDDLDWQAVIVGTPWDSGHVTALQAQHAASSVAGRIRLAGQVPDADRDLLYHQASLFALATRYEGYGIVFNEALVHGLPIISTRTGAVPDTVPNGAGVLVPADDPVAFAAALRQVLTDATAQRAMAHAAERAGAALPGWDDTARRAADVLARVVAGAL